MTAGRFFITGLPRSRTAWFSVASTTHSSICYHEPTKGLSSFDELRDFWTPKYGVDIGVSDSSLALQVGRILDELKPRTLVIHRPLDEAIKSFAKYATDNDLPYDGKWCSEFGEMSALALATIGSHPLVKTVRFGELDDYAVMCDCLKWLLPNAEFPDLKSLMGFNIQVQSSVIKDYLTIPHNGWHLL